MKQLLIIILVSSAFCLQSCMENYSTGERIGTISKFARSGMIWKSWEGELHVTQTGMNSTMNEFEFSVDNNREEERATAIATLDSAAKLAWKVRIIYHEVMHKNMTGSRGDSNFFVDSVQVLDRNMSNIFTNSRDTSRNTGGKVIDTIYVVIVSKPK